MEQGGRCQGVPNDNKTITKTITILNKTSLCSKWTFYFPSPCPFLYLFFFLSFSFPCFFLFFSFFLAFPFDSFSFLFFLFLFFSFLFLFFSFRSFSFPFFRFILFSFFSFPLELLRFFSFLVIFKVKVGRCSDEQCGKPCAECVWCWGWGGGWGGAG